MYVIICNNRPVTSRHLCCILLVRNKSQVHLGPGPAGPYGVPASPPHAGTSALKGSGHRLSAPSSSFRLTPSTASKVFLADT